MLVLSRREGEVIRINDDIFVTITKVDGKNVKVGIDAPKDVAVFREELKSGKASSRNNVLINKAEPVVNTFTP